MTRGFSAKMEREGYRKFGSEVVENGVQVATGEVFEGVDRPKDDVCRVQMTERVI